MVKPGSCTLPHETADLGENLLPLWNTSGTRRMFAADLLIIYIGSVHDGREVKKLRGWREVFEDWRDATTMTTTEMTSRWRRPVERRFQTWTSQCFHNWGSFGVAFTCCCCNPIKLCPFLCVVCPRQRRRDHVVTPERSQLSWAKRKARLKAPGLTSWEWRKRETSRLSDNRLWPTWSFQSLFSPHFLNNVHMTMTTKPRWHRHGCTHPFKLQYIHSHRDHSQCCSYLFLHNPGQITQPAYPDVHVAQWTRCSVSTRGTYSFHHAHEHNRNHSFRRRVGND